MKKLLVLCLCGAMWSSAYALDGAVDTAPQPSTATYSTPAQMEIQALKEAGIPVPQQLYQDVRDHFGVIAQHDGDGREGGETIETALVFTDLDLPYNDTGDTSDNIDDYDEVCPYTGSTSPDVVYEYTPSVDIRVDISLCNGSLYDTKLYLYENTYTPGDPFACNDDACVNYESELLNLLLTGGNTYYIVVDGYGGESGAYVFDVIPSCVDPGCPTGYTYLEAEGVCADQNGGCNSDPNVFEALALDTPLCGLTWADTSFRDTDWFEITVPSDSRVEVTLESVCIPVTSYFFAPDCDDLTSLLTLYADESAVVDTTDCLPSGTYWVWAGPGDAGGGIYENYPCLDEWHYGLNVSLVGDPCDATPPAIVHTPLVDTEVAGPWTVNADITDDSGIASADLYYQVDGGGYTMIAMTAGVPPAYSADIPAQAAGSVMDYYIVAVDASAEANSTTTETWTFGYYDYTWPPTNLVATDGAYDETTLSWSMPEAPPEPGTYFESFEAGMPGDWTIYNEDADSYQWQQYSDASAYDGDYVAGVHYNGLGCDDWLVTRELTATATTQLTYQMRNYSSSFPEDYEVYIYTGLSDPPLPADFSGPDGTLLRSGTLPADTDWHGFTEDLSAYDGGTFYIAWRCVSVDEFYLYLDAVNFTGLPVALASAFHVPNPHAHIIGEVPELMAKLNLSEIQAYDLLNEMRRQQESSRDLQTFNVYRDAVLAGTTTELTFTDDLANGADPDVIYEYTVTALWDAGESDPSDPDDGHYVVRPTSGGPDGFGYTWENSNAPLLVTYDWTDISATGTALPLVDYDYEVVALPWTFPFYYNPYTEVTVTSEGYLAFGSTYVTSYNDPIPDSYSPNNYVAGFWDDFDLDIGGTVYYEEDAPNSRMIFQYDTVELYSGAGPFTFQVILYQDGNMLIQYNTVSDVTLGTVGIENADGTDGLEINYNHDGGVVENELAILITRPAGDFLAPLVEHTPLENTFDTTGPYTVDAEITDDSGIASAYMYYRLDGVDPYTQVAMTEVLRTYTADIPGQPSGTLVDYYIEATDASVNANVTTTPVYTFSVNPTSGGPDAVGYTWVCTDADTASFVYSWTTLTAPTAITGLTDDDYDGPFPIGFTFYFYENAYTEFYVGSNGMIGFGTDNMGTLSNQQLPSTSTPNDLIAWFWDDLDYEVNPGIPVATAQYGVEGGDLVVDFVSYPEYGAYNDTTEVRRVTAQVILKQDHDIQVNYASFGPEIDMTSATVGIENSAGDIGLDVHYNNVGMVLHDELSLRYYRPPGEIIPPEIVHTPLNDTEDTVNPYTVLADITDDSGIASASVFYQVDLGGFIEVPMTPGVPPQYSGDIPAQAVGSQIDYYIQAVDASENANTATTDTYTFNVFDWQWAPQNLSATDGLFDETVITWSPPVAPLAPGEFEEGFEFGIPGTWNVYSEDANAYEWQQYNLGEGAHGGENVAGCHYGDYGVANDDWLVTDVFTATASTILDFWMKDYSYAPEAYEIYIYTGVAAPPLPADFLAEGVLLEAGTTPGDGIWYQFVYDLSAYDGSDFYIAWRYVSVWEWHLYLDDVHFTGLATEAPVSSWVSNPHADRLFSEEELIQRLGSKEAAEEVLAELEASRNREDGSRSFQTYNVYRDAVLAGSSTELTFSDNLANGADPDVVYEYTVTALWDLGESDPSDSDTGFYIEPIVYNWYTSIEDPCVEFDWVDISGVGTPLGLADDGYSEQTLPFTFTFYGQPKTSVKVCSNGYLTFGADGTDYTNDPIPTVDDPNDIICPFWDDLNPTAGGEVYFYDDSALNDRVIAQWDGVYKYGTTDPMTLQVMLYESGDIFVQYLDLQGAVNSATVGLELSDGTWGVEYAYDGTGGVIENNLAILFSQTAPSCCDTPVNFSITVNTPHVDLAWDAVPTAVDYTVYTSDVSGYGPWDAGTSTGGLTTFHDENALVNPMRYYYVTAVCPDGEPPLAGSSKEALPSASIGEK